MTTTAILFLILAVVLVWGGLAASIVRLRRDTANDDSADDTEAERSEWTGGAAGHGAQPDRPGPDGPR